MIYLVRTWSGDSDLRRPKKPFRAAKPGDGAIDQNLTLSRTLSFSCHLCSEHQRILHNDFNPSTHSTFRIHRPWAPINVCPLAYSFHIPSHWLRHRVAGFISPFLNPDWFVAAQIPLSPVYAITSSTRMVAYQLGNIYLLLAMVRIAVLYTTTEAKVVRNYVIGKFSSPYSWQVQVLNLSLKPFGLLILVTSLSPAMSWSMRESWILLIGTPWHMVTSVLL